MNKIIIYLLFIILVLGGGSVIGMTTAPDAWFAQLAKPSFNPPAWVFAPVWSSLYVMIAIAGGRTWLRERGGTAIKLWFVQLVLNFMWSPIFFRAHRIDIALVIILLLLGTILAFIVGARRQDKMAAFLFMPYLAWVSFASLLNAALLRLN